ncbi:MAG: hypothetical protein COX19_13125 [Desulfobacterales bacterium CG23_combo_of_CG06-09_8_20_14_all_51_8]|nr:MAG: hypothetical protein COX19_13125 [Desulfobacterales bacterium CG23_combo_of_CG06-09_8_20_14_all_51_8]
MPILKPPIVFGVVFATIGTYFLVYGAWHLVEIYSRPAPMFDLGTGLSPEKGMMWAKCLAGASVILMGLLMIIKAKIDGKGEKSD